jgi:hypothetical protein
MRSELPPVADPRPNSAARHQLAVFRIQILYSCARTFLEQKSRKAPFTKQFAPYGPAPRAVASCTIFKYVAQGCYTICSREHWTSGRK